MLSKTDSSDDFAFHSVSRIQESYESWLSRHGAIEASMKAMAPPRFKVERGVPLSGLSTFGIGGPARYLARCRTVSDLRLALDFARQQGLHQNKVFVIGKGSNVLFDDRGYDGLVIANELDFCDEISVASTSSNDEELSLRAGSGYAFNTLGQRLSTAGWGGLEFAAGIPGTVGGAVFMNAGANGFETCEVLACAEYMTSEGELKSLDVREGSCGDSGGSGFAYRTSPFQEMGGDLLAVVSATFSVRSSPGAKARAREYMVRRGQTQPLRDRSAGCVFRNPVGEGMPSAGALIDGAGLKGHSVGTASVSPLHANYLVCRETGAHSARDMRALIEEVRARVREHAGVELTTELKIVPFQAGEDGG